MRALAFALALLPLAACGGGGGGAGDGPIPVSALHGTYELASFTVDWQGLFGTPAWVAPGVHTEASVGVFGGVLDLAPAGTFGLSMTTAGGWDYDVDLVGTWTTGFLPGSGVTQLVLFPTTGGSATIGVRIEAPDTIRIWGEGVADSTLGSTGWRYLERVWTRTE